MSLQSQNCVFSGTPCTMDENVIPITNNPRLIFIPYKPDSSSASACIDHDFNNDIDASSVDTGEEFESIGQKNRDFFMSSYLYCLILGSISLMSGLLLSIIAFHGLNSNNSSAIMGKKKEKNTKKVSYLFLLYLRPRPDHVRTRRRCHRILSLSEQTKNVE